MSKELLNMYGCDISVEQLERLTDALKSEAWDLLVHYMTQWREYEKNLICKQNDTVEIWRAQGKIRQLEKLIGLKEMARTNLQHENSINTNE